MVNLGQPGREGAAARLGIELNTAEQEETYIVESITSLGNAMKKLRAIAREGMKVIKDLRNGRKRGLGTYEDARVVLYRSLNDIKAADALAQESKGFIKKIYERIWAEIRYVDGEISRLGGR